MHACLAPAARSVLSRPGAVRTHHVGDIAERGVTRPTHLQEERDAHMRRLISEPHGPAARRVAAALVLILALPVTAAVAAAQTGTVAGTVTDQASNAPVPSAQVTIVGTTRGTLSNTRANTRSPGSRPDRRRSVSPALGTQRRLGR